MDKLYITTALRKIAASEKKITIVQGGARAGKTMAIMMLIINECLRKKTKVLVASHSYPHLMRGVIEDYKKICRCIGISLNNSFHKQEKRASFATGSEIFFVTTENVEGLKGTQFDISFLNEANYIDYEVFNQVLIRTMRKLYIDFNPVQRFYAHDLPVFRNDAEIIKLTYIDNEACPKEIVAELERIKKLENTSNYWRNYVQIYVHGEIGGSIDCVFPDWKTIRSIPADAKLYSIGIDFGFVNDVTAIVAIYYIDNSYIIDEIAYNTGMLTDDIAKAIKLYDCNVYCDNAEPRTIVELNRLLGRNKCFGVKYKVNETIDMIKKQAIYVTEKSINIQNEQQNYVYIRDKATGVLTNEPKDAYNHAMDAIRYGFTPLYQRRNFVGHKAL